MSDAIGRREFLQLVGAGAALAGCSRPPAQKLLAYNDEPREATPGRPLHYATTLMDEGFGFGVLVESNAFRPTKVEGNREHPDSRGATHAAAQAAVLSLYDADRARGIRNGAGAATWGELVRAWGGARSDRGAGLRLLLRPTTSPLVEALLERVRARFPEARVCFYAPLGRGHTRAGAELAFGAARWLHYDFAAADVVVSLDGDFMGRGAGRVRHQGDWAARRVPSRGGRLSRLYVAEPTLSLTGGMADARLRCASGEVARIGAALLSEIALAVGEVAVSQLLRVGELEARAREFVRAAARDLLTARGRSLVYCDERQPPEVHALCAWVNQLLGNLGGPVRVYAWPLVNTVNQIEYAALCEELAQGRVEALAILGGNPLYDAPADCPLPVAHARSSLYLGRYDNESARACQWHVAEAHALESWGDARASDGTIALQQPLIAPLVESWSLVEVLALLAGEARPDAQALLKARYPGSEWESRLQRGVVEGSAFAPLADRVDGARVLTALQAKLTAFTSPPGHALELSLYPDPAVGDGSDANNAWLQELPRPFTKLTWDNALHVSAALATGLDLSDGDVVTLRAGARAVEVPLLVAAGQAETSVSLHFGYGRTGGERTAAGRGANAFLLSTLAAPFFSRGVTLHKSGRRVALARTQLHFAPEGREAARSLVAGAELPERLRRAPLSLYREVPASEGKKIGGPRPEAWSMAIELSTCVGCMACVVACQAENNVFVVGKEGILRGREMHWLRIDTYFRGALDEPRPIQQPMLCQHCEKAPCEYVCPVNATVHSPDGLNEMVYNRCIGTRFCSNNCPYKVRRFNWLRWEKEVPENGGLASLQRNPEVTVRARGVMEKCTFCVQRIRRAQIDARIENRPAATVRTACQEACPSGAIHFGDRQHPAMATLHDHPRAYQALHELGTRPRVSYLARLESDEP